MGSMIRSPLLFGRKRYNRAGSGHATALAAPVAEDVRLFGYTLLSGLVFFTAYLG